MERIIFHVDVNSAFLSWSAVYRVKVLGEPLDLRRIPSVVAGERAERHGIILAKSLPAGKKGVKTGEPLFQARQKCPHLTVVPPDYSLYVEASRHLIRLLRTFSPVVEQYSIDEAWVDMTGTRWLYGPPLLAAEQMKARIAEELGFTVNIGISSNKILAKMASGFEKPNKIHTLFPHELRQKLWPLPVRQLFMVGTATEQKLQQMGIYTIGQLANTDPSILQAKLHKPGLALWNEANGKGDERLQPQAPENKGYGNAVTTPANVTSTGQAHQVLLSLCETVAMRMRRDGKAGSCVTVTLRTAQFQTYSHQIQLSRPTDRTQEIYQSACRAFDAAWLRQEPLRLLGVQMSKLTDNDYRQYDFWAGSDEAQRRQQAKLDDTIDAIRKKYGESAIFRASFVGSKEVMAGGLAKVRRTGVTKPIPPAGPESYG